MKKIILLVVSIMGVSSVQSCVNYKVRVIQHSDDHVIYIPTQRIGLRWEDSYFAHTTLSSANGEIKEWIDKKEFLKAYKHPKFINYGN